MMQIRHALDGKVYGRANLPAVRLIEAPAAKDEYIPKLRPPTPYELALKRLQKQHAN